MLYYAKFQTPHRYKNRKRYAGYAVTRHPVSITACRAVTAAVDSSREAYAGIWNMYVRRTGTV